MSIFLVLIFIVEISTDEPKYTEQISSSWVKESVNVQLNLYSWSGWKRKCEVNRREFAKTREKTEVTKKYVEKYINQYTWHVHQHKESMKFDKALDYCKSMKMSLAVPENRKSSDMLKELTGGSFFLGITDKDIEGDFRSVYSNKSISFFDWNGRDTTFIYENLSFYFLTNSKV